MVFRVYIYIYKRTVIILISDVKRTYNVVVLVDVSGDDLAESVSDLELDSNVFNLEIFTIFFVFQHLETSLDVGFCVS